MSKRKLDTHVQIQDGEGNIVAEVSAISDKNADRLVLCWNAFRGMHTEVIKTMPGTVSEMCQNMTELYRTIENLSKLLQEIDTVLKIMVPGYEDHEASRGIAELLERTSKLRGRKPHDIH